MALCSQSVSLVKVADLGSAANKTKRKHLGEMTKMHIGAAFLLKYLLAAHGDSQLISIQVKRESHVNTGTTLLHLLPATVMGTAELSSSSVELLLKKRQSKSREGEF